MRNKTIYTYMWLYIPFFGRLLEVGMNTWGWLSWCSIQSASGLFFLLFNILKTDSAGAVKDFVRDIFAEGSVNGEATADTHFLILVSFFILVGHIDIWSILVGWNWILIAFECHHVHGHVGQMRSACSNQAAGPVLSTSSI